ncbi:MAG: glycosyltransferase family A protein [Gemmatimonadota bacterium]
MTGAAPRVSVVMPCFDAARFLAEAVESVLAQGYGSWELLVVDDGSTDGSAEIARGYAAKHPERIRCLEHPGRANRGAAASRNLGIRAARGELLALLDADDVYLPNKLEEQVALLDAHPEAGMLYGTTLLWHGWTGDPADAARDHPLPLGVPLNRVVHPPELLVRRVRGRSASPATCSILVRREVAERAGLFEDAFGTVYADQTFYAKVFLSTPVYVADALWDRYRIHPDSSWSTVQREGRDRAARRAWLEWVAAYLAARGMARGRLWRQLRTELWLVDHPRLHAALTGSRRGLRRIRQRLGARARRLVGAA